MSDLDQKELNLNFRVWVDDPENEGTMYNSPPSLWACGGMHKCYGLIVPFVHKAGHKAGTNNVILVACDICSEYLIWIEVNIKDVLQNHTIKCKSCDNFYSYVVIEGIEYNFCQKCHSSGPVKCDQSQVVRNNDVVCNECKEYCITKNFSGTEYYFCDKCCKYRGSNKKDDKSKNTKKCQLSRIWFPVLVAVVGTFLIILVRG